ncbi:YbhB/YbcL family Raf kinase inhibitor-like protein [Weissella confusa]|uniref:YbhB/YbcL family Raf kinase inhibitor-like protein n=1 Tax=Weissella confusa TaxID=1583 RepID=UPI0018F17C8C|nr:YbhB/YbcL family Raf kinase inhibitor-like protein [Weissella confusa]MBJ7619721.1 YbhB/YbcL family Raf kinase inhibitor-like protein [Weissella confusa]MBJ7666875.1 YbhB/YbcL family Raf kinase inhibitor-like protein [Weissella confusa]
MKVSVTFDNQGLLPDKYAKFAPAEYRLEDNPVVNFPIAVSDVPAGTETLAIAFIDYDAIPVGGFPWIHWTVANLPVGDVPENLTTSDVPFVPGTNSMYSIFKHSKPEITQSYIGPMPPDQTHDYTLTVYAVDTTLDLTPGYFFNELRKDLVGHVLAEASVELPARSE